MKIIICPLCDGKLVNERKKYIFLEEVVGVFECEICSKCGEEFFKRDVCLEIEKKVKEKGLWNLKCKTKINKIGNSFGLLVNKRIVDYMKLRKGDEVVVFPEGKNRFVVRKI